MIFTWTMLIARMFDIFRDDEGFWILMFISMGLDATIIFSMLPHLYK